MKRIGCGAEAVMYRCDSFGIEALAKVREPKRYRIKALDDELRALRTRREAKIMSLLAEKRVPVPGILAVGMYTIVMEKLDGTLLRDAKKSQGFYAKVGRAVGSMHRAGVVHGDMTPANIMVVGARPFIIDFGLAGITDSAEERALDILLMKRSLEVKRFASFLRGYSSGNSGIGRVVERLSIIEKRGRYQVRTLA